MPWRVKDSRATAHWMFAFNYCSHRSSIFNMAGSLGRWWEPHDRWSPGRGFSPSQLRYSPSSLRPFFRRYLRKILSVKDWFHIKCRQKLVRNMHTNSRMRGEPDSMQMQIDTIFSIIIFPGVIILKNVPHEANYTGKKRANNSLRPCWKERTKYFILLSPPSIELFEYGQYRFPNE